MAGVASAAGEAAAGSAEIVQNNKTGSKLVMVSLAIQLRGGSILSAPPRQAKSGRRGCCRRVRNRCRPASRAVRRPWRTCDFWQYAATSSSTSEPYSAHFFSPMPCTASSPSSVDGRRRARSRSVASPKTMNGGMPRSSAFAPPPCAQHFEQSPVDSLPGIGRLPSTLGVRRPAGFNSCGVTSPRSRRRPSGVNSQNRILAVLGQKMLARPIARSRRARLCDRARPGAHRC